VGKIAEKAVCRSVLEKKELHIMTTITITTKTKDSKEGVFFTALAGGEKSPSEWEGNTGATDGLNLSTKITVNGQSRTTV